MDVLTRLNDDCFALVLACLLPKDAVALALSGRAISARLRRILPLRKSLTAFSPPLHILRAAGAGANARSVAFSRREAAASAAHTHWRRVRFKRGGRISGRQGAAGCAVGGHLLLAGGWTNGMYTVDRRMFALHSDGVGSTWREMPLTGTPHPPAYGLRAVLLHKPQVDAWLNAAQDEASDPAYVVARVLLHGGSTQGSYRAVIPHATVVDVVLSKVRTSGHAGEAAGESETAGAGAGEAAALAGEASVPAEQTTATGAATDTEQPAVEAADATGTDVPSVAGVASPGADRTPEGAASPAPEAGSGQGGHRVVARRVVRADAGTRRAVYRALDGDAYSASDDVPPHRAWLPAPTGTTPIPRAFHAITWAGRDGVAPAHADAVYVYGGFNDEEGPLANLQRIRVQPPRYPGLGAAATGADDAAAKATFEDVEAIGRGPRPCFGSTLVPLRGGLLHLGGCTGRNNHKGYMQSGHELHDAHLLSLATDTPMWSRLDIAAPADNPPHFARLHTAVYTGASVLVFGGGPPGSVSDRLTRLTVDDGHLASALAQRDPSEALPGILSVATCQQGGRGPRARMDHVSDIVGNELVVACGYRNDNELASVSALALDALTSDQHLRKDLKFSTTDVLSAAKAAQHADPAAWGEEAPGWARIVREGAPGDGERESGSEKEEGDGDGASDDDDDDDDDNDDDDMMFGAQGIPAQLPTESTTGWRLLHEIDPRLGVFIPVGSTEEDIERVVVCINFTLHMTRSLGAVLQLSMAQRAALQDQGVEVDMVVRASLPVAEYGTLAEEVIRTFAAFAAAGGPPQSDSDDEEWEEEEEEGEDAARGEDDDDEA